MKILTVSCLLALVLCGCDERKPLPRHEVVVGMAVYVLDGQAMGHDQFLDELARLASRAERSPGGAVRLGLAIRSESGVPHDRVVQVIDRCAALGITKLEFR
jgi:hypothetical protein